MDVLDKIAGLILQDPFLTATEMAHRLGYAEEKTIYYWMDKAHYPGLVAFKRAVLSGQYHRRTTAAHEEVSRYGFIPIIRGFSRDGAAVLSGQHYRGLALTGDIRYAWQYDGFENWIVMHGDWLLLSFFESPTSSGNGWCVAFDADGAPSIRVFHSGPDQNQPRLLVPRTFETDQAGIPRYHIRHLFRNLP
jgi:hypothetical protein